MLEIYTKLEKLIIEEPKIIPSEKGFIGTVYIFVNKTNSKVYIGKTVDSYLGRWKEHKNLIGKSSKYFYKSLEKYGWFGFDRFVIYQTPIIKDREECDILILDKEMYYIKTFKSNDRNFGYNLTEGGDGPVGMKHSETTKKLLSEKHSGTHHWKYGTKNIGGISILQFDLDFNLIKEWPSIKEVERELGYKSNIIGRVCNRYSDSAYGFVWVKKAEYFEGYLEKYHSRAKCKSNDRAVLQYDFAGNFIKEYISAAEAGKALGGKTVAGAANGKEKQFHGYLWIYKDEMSKEKIQQKINDAKNCNLYKKFIKEHDISFE